MDKKDFLDEKIIEMMNEVEQPPMPVVEEAASIEEIKQEERTIYTGIKIKGRWVYFEERLLVEDKIMMMVPEEFTEMPEEQAKIKYPSEQRPEIILTDDTTAINLMFTYMEQEIKNEDIPAFRDDLIGGMTRLNPGIKPQERGVEIINDKNIAYVEFSNPVLDGKLYNLLYFLELEGRSLMINFNVHTKEMKYWKKAAYEMMKSIQIVSQIDEGEDEDE